MKSALCHLRNIGSGTLANRAIPITILLFVRAIIYPKGFIGGKALFTERTLSRRYGKY